MAVIWELVTRMMMQRPGLPEPFSSTSMFVLHFLSHVPWSCTYVVCAWDVLHVLDLQDWIRSPTCCHWVEMASIYHLMTHLKSYIQGLVYAYRSTCDKHCISGWAQSVDFKNMKHTGDKCTYHECFSQPVTVELCYCGFADVVWNVRERWWFIQNTIQPVNISLRSSPTRSLQEWWMQCHCSRQMHR